MRMAVIDPGTNTVENIIEAEPGFLLPGRMLVPSEAANIGWAWDGASLVPPSSPPQALVSRRLAWHEFRDLLSTEKQLAIARAARDDPRLLIFLLDAAAQGVDLDSPRTAGALDMLVASGLITGEERETLARGQSISATKAASR